MSEADWKLIRPYLEENEELFGIPVSRLLTVEGEQREPAQVYRKVAPASKAPAGGHGDDDSNAGEESDE